ncbi:TspO/MBR family protein [Enterovirga rhinocerotis]|uniref:TspO/MBR related protein n=1 Tax=Enterovirga rhinocerotis TaxID=1339210 RepID=A0A4R7BWL3_9HYPH|nr:TspO/MBR family protein [Enterovirga rhinocerotis]TDR89075.1 TspO/MBR related protein [Enterovirga rhinocerotis]
MTRSLRTDALLRTAIAVVPVAIVSILGGFATAPNIPGWYAGLTKPAGTPPNGVFGPVWTALYVMMIVSVWRLLGHPPETPGRRAAVMAFFVQLALNCLWSFAFFAARSPALGLVVILALIAALIATIRLAWNVDRIAAGLLVPYLAWVSYATYLNLGVFWLNA